MSKHLSKAKKKGNRAIRGNEDAKRSRNYCGYYWRHRQNNPQRERDSYPEKLGVSKEIISPELHYYLLNTPINIRINGITKKSTNALMNDANKRPQEFFSIIQDRDTI